MIQLPVDEAHDFLFHVSEIVDHAPMVQFAAGQLDLQDSIVSMRVGALAVVVQQPVSVAEVQPLDDGVPAGGVFRSIPVHPPPSVRITNHLRGPCIPLTSTFPMSAGPGSAP